ncbi:MAG TPA: protein translocase subunit SecD, partial [Brevundimonas sp.]|nr:protein translocase subunit SecD [Brevundimonas sp.]
MIHLSRWKVILLVLSLLFGLLFAYPNVLTPAQREALPGWLPSSGVNLGLDLQGGSYLLLEVDLPAMRAKRMANLVEDARLTMSEARIGVASIARQDNGVLITLSDPAQQEQARLAMQAIITPGPSGVADRQVQRVGDNRVRYGFTQQAFNSMGADAVTQSIEVVRRRLDPSGTKEISITRQAAERIVVVAPGQSDPGELERLVGQTAQLTF